MEPWLGANLASGASEQAAGPVCLASGNRRVGRGARPEREKAGEPAGCEGAGRPAGQHESAAARAEAAQPAGGPGGGDGAPPLPRPHQRGGPAGKLGEWGGVGARAQPPLPFPGEPDPLPSGSCAPPGPGPWLLLRSPLPHQPSGSPSHRANQSDRGHALAFLKHLPSDVQSVFLSFSSGLQNTSAEN